MKAFEEYLDTWRKIAYHEEYAKQLSREERGWRAWLRRRSWRACAEVCADTRARRFAEVVVRIARKQKRDDWVQEHHRLLAMVRAGEFPGLTLGML